LKSLTRYFKSSRESCPSPSHAVGPRRVKYQQRVQADAGCSPPLDHQHSRWLQHQSDAPSHPSAAWRTNCRRRGSAYSASGTAKLLRRVVNATQVLQASCRGTRWDPGTCLGKILLLHTSRQFPDFKLQTRPAGVEVTVQVHDPQAGRRQGRANGSKQCPNQSRFGVSCSPLNCARTCQCIRTMFSAPFRIPLPNIEHPRVQLTAAYIFSAEREQADVGIGNEAGKNDGTPRVCLYCAIVFPHTLGDSCGGEEIDCPPPDTASINIEVRTPGPAAEECAFQQLGTA
jgi:hypothetical protein